MPKIVDATESKGTVLLAQYKFSRDWLIYLFVCMLINNNFLWKISLFRFLVQLSSGHGKKEKAKNYHNRKLKQGDGQDNEKATHTSNKTWKGVKSQEQDKTIIIVNAVKHTDETQYLSN